MRAEELDKILATVQGITGIDLVGYRRPMLERRLAARIRALRLGDSAAYLQRLKTHPDECHRLIDAVGINVSSFFRNPLVFEIIKERIIPDILERRGRMPSNEIRVWSAGCSKGEEVYSIAILLHMALRGKVGDWVLHIFATDMDGEALEMARTATYPRESFEFTKLGVLDNYFKPNESGFELRPFIRKMVRFSKHDLTSRTAPIPPDSVFGGFDLTLCRNVLIYFSRDTQARVLGNLCKSVAKGGYLVLGESEALFPDVEEKLDTVDKGSRIYRKRLG